MFNTVYTDILIIGTGIAGLTAAIKLAENGYKITILNKSNSLFENNTAKAQGGIIYKSIDDNEKLLSEDIIKASKNTACLDAVRHIAKYGPHYVKEFLLDKLKVEFDTTDNGEYDLTLEAAHRKKRILHYKDITGQSIQKSLVNYVKNIDNIKILNDVIAIDLLTPQHHTNDIHWQYKDIECFGAYVLSNKTHKVLKILAKATILATGGLGQIYLHTTNSKIATGDGFAMAKRAGAQLINMEFIQFHPTTLYHRDANNFLISESVRGEGAKLKTPEGKEFMQNYHPDGSLAPRDVVSSAIYEELIKNDYSNVYLDLKSYMPSEKIKNRFPNIYKICLKYNIDITKDMIPVIPAAHFACGGIRVDLKGRTNVKRLYAIGEVSCTGVHGVNRLASTSLLEGLVWGISAANDIKENFKNYLHIDKFPDILDWKDTGTQDLDFALLKQDWITLKSIMWNYVGIIKNKKRLQRALKDLIFLNNEIESFYKTTKLNMHLIELRNAIQTAIIVTKAAFKQINKKE